LREGHPAISKAIDALLARKDADPQLVMQLYNSLGKVDTQRSKGLLAAIRKSHGNHPIFAGIAAAEEEKKQLAALGQSSKRGQVIYKSICVTCHGDRGLGVYEGDTLLAPPLAESPLFMRGSQQAPLAAQILINGMTGPVRGRHYGEGVMIPFGQTYDDEQLADVINYIGFKWNRRSWGEPITANTIATAREATADRSEMWTDAEMREEAEKLGLTYTFKKRTE